MFMLFNSQSLALSRISRILLLVLLVNLFGITLTYGSDEDITLESVQALPDPDSKVIESDSGIKADVGGNRYYYTGSTVTSSTQLVNNDGQFMTSVTYSIAYSISGLATKLSGYIDGIEGYIDGIESTLSTISSKTSSSDTHLDYIEDYASDISVDTNAIKQDVTNIRSALVTANSHLNNIKSYTDGIETKLDTIISTIPRISIKGFNPYFLPDPDIYDYTDSSWNTMSASYLDTNGDRTATTINQESGFLQLRNLTRYTNNTTTNGFYRLIGQVIGANQTALNQFFSPISGSTVQYFNRSLWADVRTIWYYLSATLRNIVQTPQAFALTDYTNTTSTVQPVSMYDYLTMLGANISQSVGRLAFVLANDDDIALRQQNADNITSVKNNLNGNNGLTPAKIVNAKNIGTDVTSGLSSNASISDGTSVLNGNSDAWDWFTSDTANALDSVSQMRSQSIEYKYLNQYEKEMSKYVGKSSRTNN